MKERLSYVDIARAIAIIFIVIGHALVHSEHCTMIYKILYSFHVFLFFVISGFTFSVKDNFLDFLKKKFKRLMIPYFFWALAFLIPYFMFGQDVGTELDISSNFTIIEQIKNVFYGIGLNSGLKQNSALWFLPALFITEILYYYIAKKFSQNKLQRITVLIIGLVVGILSSMLKIYLPWGINTFLNIGVFFWLGYILKQHKEILVKNKKNYLIIFVLTIIGVFFAIKNKLVLCISYDYGNYLYALISAFCLSLSTILISVQIDKCKWLEYIGKNTMGILVFHKLIILIFQTKLGVISKLFMSSNIFIELIITIIATSISIIISIICAKIIEKIMPILVGQTKENGGKIC